MPGGLANTYARLDQDELLGNLAVLNAPLAEQLADSRGLYSLGSQARKRLEFVMHHLLQQAQSGLAAGLDPGPWRSNLMEQILLTLSSNSITLSGTVSNLHARRRAWRIAYAAREYMESCLHAGIVPNRVDLCRRVQVSERTLRDAFRRQFHHPPSVYLRLIRLNGVRNELLYASPSVTSVTAVATRWGFVQLGRFAQDYRRLFGERPSETLLRS
jgi:AraC family ethanolamine operon transcriptional activator